MGKWTEKAVRGQVLKSNYWYYSALFVSCRSPKPNPCQSLSNFFVSNFTQWKQSYPYARGNGRTLTKQRAAISFVWRAFWISICQRCCFCKTPTQDNGKRGNIFNGQSSKSQDFLTLLQTDTDLLCGLWLVTWTLCLSLFPYKIGIISFPTSQGFKAECL